MNSLTHLGKVVKRMKKHELNALSTYLNSIKVDRIYKDSKCIRLIDLLADDKQPNVPEVLQFKIYGKSNLNAFQKLVERTKDRVYESLLFENNLNRSNIHQHRNRVGYELRKRLMEAEILSTRGLSEDIESLYERMLKKAILFEFYDIVLEILYIQHTFSSFRYGIKRIRRIAKQIEKFESIRKRVNYARVAFDSFAAKINFSASAQDYLYELPGVIKQLQEDYDFTKSPTVGYFLYFIKVEYHQQKKEYLEAGKNLDEMKELVKNNVSVYTRNRLGNVYSNLANNEMLMHRFDEGIKQNHKARECFKESLVNLNVLKEVEFFLLIFQGLYVESEIVIHELYLTSAKQKTSFLFYKRTYLYACLKNIQGDYKRSEELLNEVKEIEKDKEGWNIGIRLLQIMNLIDRGKHDLIESNIQNLKKYLGRLKGQRQARKRYSVILRILTRLMNDNYYFSKTFKRSQKYFDLLLSKDEQYSWTVKAPEVVAFHEWFISRMEMRKFSYDRIFKS